MAQHRADKAVARHCLRQLLWQCVAVSHWKWSIVLAGALGRLLEALEMPWPGRALSAIQKEELAHRCT